MMKNPTRVLYIDDDQTALYAFERMIDLNKYRLDTSDSIEHGLTLMAKQEHDIYFLDYRLGEKNALDIIARARALKCYGPFILLSQHDKHQYFSRSTDYGVYDYLLKSELTPSLLDRAIFYALDRWKHENALRFEKNCFNFVINTVPYVVLHIDTDFYIQQANDFALKILNYSYDDIINHDFFKFIRMDDKQTTKSLFFKPSNDLISFRSLWSHPKDKRLDKTFLWDCVKRPLPNKSKTNTDGYLCIGKDLTQDLAIDVDDSWSSRDIGQSLDDISSAYGNRL